MVGIDSDKYSLDENEGVPPRSHHEEFGDPVVLGVDDFISPDISGVAEEDDMTSPLRPLTINTEDEAIQHRRIEYRPRSLSFPFTAYKQWKLFQTKKCEL